MSWRGQGGRCDILEVWRLAPVCLVWCIWTEHNVRSLEDRETLVVELKNIIFNSLYTWITAHNRVFFSNFLNLCSSFTTEYKILLYTSNELGLRPSAFYNEIKYLSKKITLLK